MSPYARSRQIWACPSDLGGALAYNDVDGVGTLLEASPSASRSLNTSYAYRAEVGFRGLRNPLECASGGCGSSEIGLVVDASPNWHVSRDFEMDLPRLNLLFADSHAKFTNVGGPRGYLVSWLNEL